MKTQTFAAAQHRFDNLLPPEDNLFAQELESFTLEDLIEFGTVGNDHITVSDTEEYQAELALRPAPENVELLFDTDLDEFAGTVFVYDSNYQTEHTVTEYPQWLQHIIPGWTRLTSFRCAERVQRDYQNYLLTTGDLL